MFQRRHPVDWSVLLSALLDVDGHAGHAEHLRQVDHDETGQGLPGKAGIRACGLTLARFSVPLGPGLTGCVL